MPHVALQPHPDSPRGPVHAIEVDVQRAGEALRLRYVVRGELSKIRIPPFGEVRPGKDLWRTTCVELFAAADTGPGYEEFNFSPSGEYAAYRFKGYRDGAAWPLTVAPEIAVTVAPESLTVSIQIETVTTRVGLSAVVEATDGGISYWAMRHPAAKPDFHHPDSFALELA